MTKKWTENEIKILVNEYPQRGRGWCMRMLNRSDASIRQKLSSLGLKQDKKSAFFKDWQNRAGVSKVGKKRPEQSKVMAGLWKEGKIVSASTEVRKVQNKDLWKKNKHPKGMLGKTHSDKMKADMSIRVKKEWKDPASKFNSKEFRLAQSERASKMMVQRIRNKGSIYSRSQNGWYTISGKRYYFRSSWEVNYARYLEFIRLNGEIDKWEYEPDTFWFEKIRRGVRSYTPDFKVFNNGKFEYHEVKGWMDNKSKTKIKRMSIYYPEIKLLVIDKDIYKNIKGFERLYPEASESKKPE